MQHIPTFIATPAMGWATFLAANTTTDGTTATALIFPAGANGGKNIQYQHCPNKYKPKNFRAYFCEQWRRHCCREKIIP